MPKGVEHHEAADLLLAILAVPLALMPKGVEHHDASHVRRRSVMVPLALMPKGVEHGGSLLRTCRFCGGAPRIDAERR